MGVTIDGKVYGKIKNETKLKFFKGMPGHGGKFLKESTPKRWIMRDHIGKVVLTSGQFVSDEIIKRFHLNPGHFIHPDSLRTQGSFEFAHEKKGKFSVAITRDMNGRGDVLMASVICKALKYQYGDNVTTMMCVKPGYEDILLHNSYVDQVFTDRDLLLNEKPDITINVNDMEFKTELKLFEQTEQILKNRTSIYLEQMGLYLENKTPEYNVTKAERAWAEHELEDQGYDLSKSIVGIQLHGSNLTRTYLHMWKVIELLMNEKIQVLVLDLKNEGTVQYQYTLRQVGALIEQMTTTVTPNSYMYHLAGAMKKRALALFGSCEGSVWVQDYEKVVALDGKCPGRKIKCWWTMPCLPGTSLREKEKGKTPDCLDQIKPERVVEEVKKQIIKSKKILVVVLTYNMSHLTKEMIDSVRSNYDYDLLVIDNASIDDTIVWCKSRGIKTIVKKQHVDEAWNMALNETISGGYDYLLLCNNDCILSPTYVDTLVEVADRRQAFLVTGQVVNRQDLQQSMGFQEMIKSVEITQNVMIAGDYSALLISKECIKKIGGFKYFAPRYQCDEDHMLRVRLYGKELVKTYATTFLHKHGAVVKSAEFNDARRKREWMEGVHNFKKKWGIDIYTDRNELRSLDRIKDLNDDWEDRIFEPY